MNGKNNKILLMESSKEVLDRGYTLRAPIIGTCMHPFFIEKDIIIGKSILTPEMHIGDIIIYTPGDVMKAHRVIRKYKKNDKTVVITKGDNILDFDIPLNENKILGKVISIEKPGESVINLETRTWRIINYIIAIYSLSTGLIYRKLWLTKRIFIGNRNSRLINFIAKILRFIIFVPLKLFVKSFIWKVSKK